MDARERQQHYRKSVESEARITERTGVHDAFGVSNSAKVIEKGLFACNVNFNTIASEADQIVVNCLLRFPPEDEIYFSLYIRHEVDKFHGRLEEMKAAGNAKSPSQSEEHDGDSDETDGGEAAVSPETTESDAPSDLEYTNNNKNVKGYIALDGRLYLRNKGYWASMPDDLSTISKPVSIDRVAFSIYPPAASARRSLLAREFVGYLGNLIGREKIHELQIWSDATAVHADMRRKPSSIPLGEIQNAVENLGGFYPGGEVRQFHAALNFLDNKHFVILSGISGTGKTQLALTYARATHGLADMQATDPFLSVCPVRPEWTDPAALTGYYDVLSNRYVVPPFLEAVLVATAHRDSPVFVLLDELNLARVEYYFSDVLSSIESGEPLQLHSSSVPLEGSTGSSIPAEIPLPDNLYVIGTVNVDETTSAVSDKVLDRAMVIEMSDVCLADFLDNLVLREPSLDEAKSACETKLNSTHDLMSQHELGFGYRVAEEVVRYHSFSQKHLETSANEIMDDLMVQKILVKLRGTERQRNLLTGLIKELEVLPRSKALLAKLVIDLDEYGSFQARR